MNGFIKTLVTGLAALCVLLIAAGTTAIATMRSDGTFSAQALRALVLTKDERERLAMGARLQTAADPGGQRPENEQEMLAHIADLANAAQANQLMARLRRQQESLDERQTWLDQQWADLQLAKAGLERIQRQSQEQERKLVDQVKDQAAERARWAAAQVSETERVQVIGQVEKARYKDQAKLFEQMKDAAWLSMRRFTPRDIARYLALMDPKKASRLLVLAQQDLEQPDVATSIHREMLRLDLEGATGEQSERLATLYSFMPADQVLSYLRASSAQDVADLLLTMEKKGLAKKRAELMEALRKEDGAREMDVRTLLEKAKPKDAVQ